MSQHPQPNQPPQHQPPPDQPANPDPNPTAAPLAPAPLPLDIFGPSPSPPPRRIHTSPSHHRRNAISLSHPAQPTIDSQLAVPNPTARYLTEAERQARLDAAMDAAMAEVQASPPRPRLDISSIISSAERRTMRRRRLGGRISARCRWADGESDAEDEGEMGRGLRGLADLTFEARLALENDGILRDEGSGEVLVDGDLMEEVMRARRGGRGWERESDIERPRIRHIWP